MPPVYVLVGQCQHWTNAIASPNVWSDLNLRATVNSYIEVKDTATVGSYTMAECGRFVTLPDGLQR